MNPTKNNSLYSAKRLLAVLGISMMGVIYSGPGNAQAGDLIRAEYPELATLFNAFDVTQGAAYEKMAEIANDPANSAIRNELAMHFRMMSTMTMSEMMSSGMGHDMSNMMSGSYGEQEVEARVELLEMMRGEYSDEVAAEAFIESSAVNRHLAEVIRRGRSFENRLFEIYIDDSISDKQAAVQAAIDTYLEDDQHSVAIDPKDSTYLLGHPQGTGFQTSFPRLSGFLWTQQWLQLAVLEAVILESLDEEASDGVDTALERFWNKIGSAGGMSMFPAPTELPMAPAIAPNLYSQSAQAAIILDNLNVLETMIADTLVFPNFDAKEERIDAIVADFTNKSSNTDDPMNYLLFALRGGIYNQGGPAVGELMQSERNRSRAMMDMQHTMIMSSPQ